MSFPIASTALLAGIPLIPAAISSAADGIANFTSFLSGAEEPAAEVGEQPHLSPTEQLQDWAKRLRKSLSGDGWPESQPVELQVNSAGRIEFSGDAAQQQWLQQWFRDNPEWQKELQAITKDLSYDSNAISGAANIQSGPTLATNDLSPSSLSLGTWQIALQGERASWSWKS